MGLPVELITTGLSSVLSFTGSIIAMKMKASAHRERLMLDRFNVEERSRQRAERHDTPSKRWTRRVLTLAAVGSILIFPMIASTFFGANVTLGWTEVSGGFWPFFGPKSHMIWHSISSPGIVLTPLHTNLMAAIIGFYFGGSVASDARYR